MKNKLVNLVLSASDYWDSEKQCFIVYSNDYLKTTNGLMSVQDLSSGTNIKWNCQVVSVKWLCSIGKYKYELVKI